MLQAKLNTQNKYFYLFFLQITIAECSTYTDGY